jgi:MYXO-CTERM domain-containing protein
MHLLSVLLAIVATAGVHGNAGAASTQPHKAAERAAAADQGAGFSPSVPASYSFADIVNLPAGAEHRLLSGGEDTLSGPSRVNHSTSARPSMVSSLDGAFDDLPANSSGVRPAVPNSTAEILFPTDEIPAPSGWMLLLSGLALAGFMARRRGGSSAD